MRKHKTIEGTSFSTITQLPEEIIQEILTYLPVKSVFRFKSVSKRWRSLISTKRFTEEHLKKSSHFKLIYSFFDEIHESFTLRSCPLKHILDEPRYEDYSVIATSDHTEIRNSSPSVGIKGSCNGLLLIAIDNKELLLWNPSTRQVKNLPPSFYSEPVRCHQFDLDIGGFWPYDEYFGVGYDDSADDYKVVYMFSSSPTAGWTEIYSLRTDSWKKIDNFNVGSPVCDSGKFVNRKLHWLMWEYPFVGRRRVPDELADSCGWFIVSLDLVKEKYEIMSLPQHFASYSNCSKKMEILGGYLSMIYTDMDAGDTIVWVMIKYGDPDSWTKIWTQSEYVDPNLGRDLSLGRENGDSGFGMPILLREDGDIVVLFGTLVVVYNVKDKWVKSCVYVADWQIIEPNVYVESLVSPLGIQQHCQ